MLETFTNRKLADLGCRFDARERRSQGRFQLFPRSLAGHGVINKEGKELVSEMPSVTGQQSDPLGTRWAVRSIGIDLRKETETPKVGLGDISLVVTVEAMGIDETGERRKIRDSRVPLGKCLHV